MLNIHLNGEVVLTPDFANIQKRKMERYEHERRCKYGMEEIKCSTWYNLCMTNGETKPISEFGRCPLSCLERCPMHVRRKETGLMKKNYSIDSRMYRKMQSVSHYLFKKFDCKPLFVTLTFPPFIKHLYPYEANKLFSKFIANLRKRHGINGYVAVRENGTKFGRLHFHLVVSMPFVSFSYLNCYWCWTIRDYCKFAFNAFQVDPETKFIKNPVRAMFYVSKYFSKTSVKSESRVVFISKNLLSEKYIDCYDRKTGQAFYKKISKIKKTYNYSELPVNDFFDKYPSLVVTYQNDYTTGFKIANSKDFSNFCTDFLYKIFDLPDRNNDLLLSR